MRSLLLDNLHLEVNALLQLVDLLVLGQHLNLVSVVLNLHLGNLLLHVDGTAHEILHLLLRLRLFKWVLGFALFALFVVLGIIGLLHTWFNWSL